MYYTGIGSRSTPVAMAKVIGQIARKLFHDPELNYYLRTGDASGADRMFSSAVPAEVYSVDSLRKITPEALAKTAQLVRDYHPLKLEADSYAFKLHQRNALQVLGPDLRTPSKFVICWANHSTFDSNGLLTSVGGGTGQAIRIAYAHGIQCFNLNHPPHLERIQKWVG